MNNEKLQILTSKTLDLHDRMKEKINEHGFRFCSHCSNHGRYCVVAAAQGNPDEKERMILIAIRDSLEELHHLIISLQKMRSTHVRQRHEALARVEESRKELVERVNRCSQSQKLDVLQEVVDFSLNLKWEIDDQKIEEEEKKKNVNGMYSFLVKITRFGLEFAVVSATIYTLAKSRQQKLKKDVRDSRIQKENPWFLLQTHSDVHLDVSCGRG